VANAANRTTLIEQTIRFIVAGFEQRETRFRTAKK
jgi:hypothetical protein